MQQPASRPSLEPKMYANRPLAFLDSAGLFALSLALLAAASWTQVFAADDTVGFMDAETAVAEVLQADTGLTDDELSRRRAP